MSDQQRAAGKLTQVTLEGKGTASTYRMLGLQASFVHPCTRDTCVVMHIGRGSARASGGQVEEPEKDARTLEVEAERFVALTEPGGDGETPRVTFRRGCSNIGSITDVLGGIGTKFYRFVSNDRILADGHVLIKKGELKLDQTQSNKDTVVTIAV